MESARATQSSQGSRVQYIFGGGSHNSVTIKLNLPGLLRASRAPWVDINMGVGINNSAAISVNLQGLPRSPRAPGINTFMGLEETTYSQLD